MGWNEDHSVFTIDEFGRKDQAKYAVECVRNGDTRPLQTYSKEDMEQHLSKEDYGYWLNEVIKFNLALKMSS